MTSGTRNYAAEARQMAFRAVWIDSGKKLPIPEMPKDWSGDEVFQFRGIASPTRQFAIQRFFEAQRGAPPDFDDPVLRCQSAALKLWADAREVLPRAAELLGKLAAPVQAFQSGRAVVVRERPAFGVEPHASVARSITAAHRAVQAALRDIERLTADEERVWGQPDGAFPSVLPLRGKKREARPFDRAFEHSKLVPQGEDLDGKLAARLHERECGEEQSAQEVQHGREAWSGPRWTSTISQKTTFSGGTGGVQPGKRLVPDLPRNSLRSDRVPRGGKAAVCRIVSKHDPQSLR